VLSCERVYSRAFLRFVVWSASWTLELYGVYVYSGPLDLVYELDLCEVVEMFWLFLWIRVNFRRCCEFRVPWADECVDGLMHCRFVAVDRPFNIEVRQRNVDELIPCLLDCTNISYIMYLITCMNLWVAFALVCVCVIDFVELCVNNCDKSCKLVKVKLALVVRKLENFLQVECSYTEPRTTKHCKSDRLWHLPTDINTTRYAILWSEYNILHIRCDVGLIAKITLFE